MEIKDLKTANWAVKTIRDHQQTIKKFEKVRDDFIKYYEEKIAIAKSNCNLDCEPSIRAIETLTDALREYAAENIPQGRKKLRLPEGDLVFQSNPVQFYFEDGTTPAKDSQQLIQYLSEHDSKFIEVAYKAKWNDFKKSLQYDLETGEVINEDGEIIKGMYVLKPADKFKINITGDDSESGENS